MTFFFLTLNLLALNLPLLAILALTIAINLDLACLPFLPAVSVYAISNIIANSPKSSIVKQVDHIVGKIIVLLFNFTCINITIWWQHIFKPNSTVFDATIAKQLLFRKILPMGQQFTSFGIPLYAQFTTMLLCQLPILYFTAHVPNAKQLVRACVVVASLSFLVGIKDLPTLVVCPLSLLVPMLVQDLTPFWTAIALMVNLSLKHAGSVPSLWYCCAQTTLILGGGSYEKMILSDYGSQQADQDTFFWFWTGKPSIDMSSPKEVTRTSKSLRECRNLIFNASLFSVVVIDPIAQLGLSAFYSQLISTVLAKSLVLLVGLMYTMSLMYQETKQNRDLCTQR